MNLRRWTAWLLPMVACATFSMAQSDKPSGIDPSKWGKEHVGTIPFVFGFEKGQKEAAFSGKPMFVFFTATW